MSNKENYIEKDRPPKETKNRTTIIEATIIVLFFVFMLTSKFYISTGKDNYELGPLTSQSVTAEVIEWTYSEDQEQMEVVIDLEGNFSDYSLKGQASTYKSNKLSTTRLVKVNSDYETLVLWIEDVDEFDYVKLDLGINDATFVFANNMNQIKTVDSITEKPLQEYKILIIESEIISLTEEIETNYQTIDNDKIKIQELQDEIVEIQENQKYMTLSETEKSEKEIESIKRKITNYESDIADLNEDIEILLDDIKTMEAKQDQLRSEIELEGNDRNQDNANQNEESSIETNQEDSIDVESSSDETVNSNEEDNESSKTNETSNEENSEIQETSEQSEENSAKNNQENAKNSFEIVFTDGDENILSRKSYIAGVEYEKDDLICTVNGREYYYPNVDTDCAVYGTIIITQNKDKDKQYVGPILVSKDPKAVEYGTSHNEDKAVAKEFTYNGDTWYYGRLYPMQGTDISSMVTVNNLKSYLNEKWYSDLTDAAKDVLDTFGVKIETPETPTMKGYVFKGWNQPVSLVDQSKTITALWEKEEK